jgi:hypothetical protein
MTLEPDRPAYYEKLVREVASMLSAWEWEEDDSLASELAEKIIRVVLRDLQRRTGAVQA